MHMKLNTNLISLTLTEKGMSQSDLASKLQVSRQAVTDWLAGSKFPRPANLLQMTRLLGVAFNDLIIRDTSLEPRIAFRKKGNTKTTQEHIDRAVDMGRALNLIAAKFSIENLSSPSTLINPSLEYDYVEKAAAQLRKHLGYNEKDVIKFESLIHIFSELHAVIVPVLWGNKKNHENALHVYLPESRTTWVYLNLDCHVFDFKFWMAHELGHIKAPQLLGDEAEDFADAFAGSLLFGQSLAKLAYEELSQINSEPNKIYRLKQIASDHLISLYTVLGRTNKYAERYGLPKLDIKIGPVVTKFNQNFPLVSELVYKTTKPTPTALIQTGTTFFNTPFFAGLSSYLKEYNKGPSFVSKVLHIPFADAKALHDELIHGRE